MFVLSAGDVGISSAVRRGACRWEPARSAVQAPARLTPRVNLVRRPLPAGVLLGRFDGAPPYDSTCSASNGLAPTGMPPARLQCRVATVARTAWILALRWLQILGRKSLWCPALSPLHGARGPYAIAVMRRVFSCADHVTQVGARACIGREIRVGKKAAELLSDDFRERCILRYARPLHSKIRVRCSQPLITSPKPVITSRDKTCEIDRNPESTAPVACPILTVIAPTLQLPPHAQLRKAIFGPPVGPEIAGHCNVFDQQPHDPTKRKSPDRASDRV